LLNPAGISRAVITRQPPTEQRKTAAAPAAPPTRVERDKPAPAQTPKAEMAAAWQGLDEDVSAGRASLDSTLGLVYSEAPEQADDLQAIKGVGKVLNDKLNDFGIYTYRQIAGWDDSIVAEFSTRLSFKDRVKRDDWVGQAKALHKEKYAEELG
jgi:predicted flap endonuclease-1-like 5' DNA nuclease